MLAFLCCACGPQKSLHRGASEQNNRNEQERRTKGGREGEKKDPEAGMNAQNTTTRDRAVPVCRRSCVVSLFPFGSGPLSFVSRFRGFLFVSAFFAWRRPACTMLLLPSDKISTKAKTQRPESPFCLSPFSLLFHGITWNMSRLSSFCTICASIYYL